MSEDKKICPLNIGVLQHPQQTYSECLKDKCAWWISHYTISTEAIGEQVEIRKITTNRCAIAEIAMK